MTNENDEANDLKKIQGLRKIAAIHQLQPLISRKTRPGGCFSNGPSWVVVGRFQAE